MGQLINKVAGVYGLITIFVGGTFVQLLFYAYSVATLFAFLWALRIVKSVSSLTIIPIHVVEKEYRILTLTCRKMQTRRY